ncbi:hypothetical protein [Streptomyces sp. WMMC897]|uniref:hypothetical protein n=1 Tax=Streptomyces sp. WMMC897 TaxID=3014782 RepID=UPI0022B6BE28|nr:hypothetical protein [Streptomyces sp. WMMC897]MCZ7413103.1 hypothetical protein [Streptomyces sp. WMMC897]MCZ7413155.1 hypothetical protein [Streptomyces sp. WMMC897]MCZ7415513.1 hypothetical protein [Streptomyces sp. WMMC897]
MIYTLAALAAYALGAALVVLAVDRDVHVRQSLTHAVAHGAVTCTATAVALLYLGGIR